MIGLFGGSFDPPHRGHVELARRAKQELGLSRLLVLVSARPEHKDVHTPIDLRMRLARAAFPGDGVLLDEHPRTIDTLVAHPEWHDPVFLIGADEFGDFLSWKQPDAVLERTRFAVATRPGFPRDRLDGVLAKLRRPERVLFFEIEPTPLASRDLRERLERGEDVSAAMPTAVAEIVRAEGLYRGGHGYNPGA